MLTALLTVVTIMCPSVDYVNSSCVSVDYVNSTVLSIRYPPVVFANSPSQFFLNIK